MLITFGDARWKIENGDNKAGKCTAIYQVIMKDEHRLRQEYAKTFDLIIADECHCVECQDDSNYGRS